MQFKWQCGWVECRHKQDAATSGYGKLTLMYLRCGKPSTAMVFRRSPDDKPIATMITPKVE